LNITQCNKGAVNQGVYETGRALSDIGVIGGGDLTREAAVTKMMHVVENMEGMNSFTEMLSRSIRGEMSM
jgi:L-asparaginase